MRIHDIDSRHKDQNLYIGNTQLTYDFIPANSLAIIVTGLHVRVYPTVANAHVLVI